MDGDFCGASLAADLSTVDSLDLFVVRREGVSKGERVGEAEEKEDAGTQKAEEQRRDAPHSETISPQHLRTWAPLHRTPPHSSLGNQQSATFTSHRKRVTFKPPRGLNTTLN